MENKRKLPPKHKEVARALAAFIVEHWHCCPVPESVPVDRCAGWGSDPAACLKCVQRHAEELRRYYALQRGMQDESPLLRLDGGTK